MEFVTIGVIIIGIVILLWTRKLEKQERKKIVKQGIAEEKVLLEKEKNNEILLEQLNKKFLDLNEYYEYITQEIEKKYQELVFIYALVNEKSRASEIPKVEAKIEMGIEKDNKTVLKPKARVEPITPIKLNEDKRKRILNLYNEGLQIEEIAKNLQLGKGEVKLILDLFK